MSCISKTPQFVFFPSLRYKAISAAVILESMKSIIADIDNTILGAFAILDEQHSAFKINVTKVTITYAVTTYEGTTESTINQEGKDMTIKTTMKRRHVGPYPK
jgi:hypothetical protein